MIDPAAFLFSFSHGMLHSITRICRLKLRPSFEFFFVIAIISTSVIIAIGCFKPLLLTAKMTQALGHSSMARMEGIFYYAHHGTWPRDNPASLSTGWQQDYRGKAATFIREARVVEGAIDFYFKWDLTGKVLTMRHALPQNDASAVIWVCGNRRSDKGWVIIGEDRTNFEAQQINRRLW